jgi:hypothetical protein
MAEVPVSTGEGAQTSGTCGSPGTASTAMSVSSSTYTGVAS